MKTSVYIKKLIHIIKIKLGLGDSVDKVKRDIVKAQVRLGEIGLERTKLIEIGQQEVKDMEELVRRTRERVQEENKEHTKVVNDASNLLTVIKTVK